MASTAVCKSPLPVTIMDFGFAGPLFELLQAGESAHMGHVDVHQHHIVGVVGRHVHGFVAIAGGVDGELFPFQHPVAETQKQIAVVDDEHRDGLFGGWSVEFF